MWASIILLCTCMLVHSVQANALPDLHEPFDIHMRSDNDDYLLQNDEERYVHVNDEDYNESLMPNCSYYATEKTYERLENGSLYLPNQNLLLDYDAYAIRNSTAFFCDNREAVPSHNLSEEFTTCGHILIDPDEYDLLKNGSVFIEIYSRTYGPSDYLIVKKGVYICIPSFKKMSSNITIPEDYQKFSRASDIITLVGLVISIVSLMSHLIVFCLVPSVRNLPGYSLASLSLSLLMAYVCFLVAFLAGSDKFCVGLGMGVYYFFLTSFFWMNAIAFDVWRSFRVVMRELRITSHRLPWRRFLVYCLYSWAIPALLVVMVRIFDTTDLLPVEFKPSFGHPYCWFGQRKALLVFFAIPLIVVMLLNVVFFADVIYVINRATMKNTTAHDQLKKRFVMFTRLALIMGLTWIFGIAAGFADQPVLWYIFIILNTLQGLFIFAVFLASSKVRSLCFKQYRNTGKRSSTGTSVRTVSAAL